MPRTEITGCPRLFTISNARPEGLEKLKPQLRYFQLTLWCEHPGAWHPCTQQGSYRLDRPADWFREVSRYARPVFTLLRVAVPLAGTLSELVLTKEQLDHASKELDLMTQLLDELPGLAGDNPDWLTNPDSPKRPADGAYLRGVRQLLDEIDPYRKYGELQRVQASSGEYLWVCPFHVTAYDPGMPIMQ